ncbi:MAG: hypothetical protein R3E12_15115 [Candidatus Eisenbacteria bacterium]
MPSDRVTLLIATIKGAFLIEGDAGRKSWKVHGPTFLGAEINHLVQDPRERQTILMGARTGHLGPTVFRSNDWGKSWKEASQPPAFPKVARGTGRRVRRTFFLTPGHAAQPGSWYLDIS